MKPFIPRPDYLQKVIPFVNNQIIKVFTGQRRVGKSYLMYQTMDYIKQTFGECNIIYINKELNEFDFIQHYNQLYATIKERASDRLMNFVFIDEIQTVDGFENALKSLWAEGNFDIYCTGSNADLLSGELATYLGGRYIEIQVFPLDFNEFRGFHKLENTAETLQLYLKYGGLPYLKNLTLSDDVVFDYLKNIYQAILYRDVIRRFKIRNADFLERLVLFLAKNNGTLFSARNIVKFLKAEQINISVSAVLDYLQFLEKAFLIHRVVRTDLQGKKVFEVGEKFYFNDLGLRNAIAGYSPFDLGLMVENIIHAHLLREGYKVFIGQDGTREIDFVAQKNGETVYIQAALRITETATQEREFGNLLAIPNHYPKYVVTLDEYTGTSYHGIKHFPLRLFLSEFE